MANNKATVLQHEPLRIPAKWDGESRALVIQIERVLDDAFWRIGDLTKKVKELQEAVAALQEEE